MIRGLFIILLVFWAFPAKTESGYDLWLRYPALEDPVLKNAYQHVLQSIAVLGSGQTPVVIKDELERASAGMLGTKPAFSPDASRASLVISPLAHLPLPYQKLLRDTANLGSDGFHRCR